LDLVVLVDSSGELGDLYNWLRCVIQRWCVDVCSEYGWEIFFLQMILYGAVACGIDEGTIQGSLFA